MHFKFLSQHLTIWGFTLISRCCSGKSASQSSVEFKIFSQMEKKIKRNKYHCEKCWFFTLKLNDLYHWSWVLPKQLSTWNSIMQYETIYMRKQKQKEAFVLFSLNYIHKYLQPLSPLIQIMITIECSYMSRSSDLLLEFVLLTWNFSTQTATLV